MPVSGWVAPEEYGAAKYLNDRLDELVTESGDE
jgi:hypothetical protein